MRARSRNTILAAAAAAVLITAGMPAGAQDKVQIDFWQRQFEDYQQAWFKEQVDAFNAAQDKVEVIYTVVPGDAWDAKLVAAQAANVAPDVATTNYGAIKPGVVDGKFAKLDDLLPAEALADIEPWVKDFVTAKDGGVYGYPMLVEPSTVLFYRKSLLEAAGITAPPKSWEELLLTAARALTTDDVYGMNIGQTAGDLGWSSWGLQLNAAGHLPIADDWSAGRATEQGFKDLAQFYATLYQEQLMPQEATYGYADCSFFGEGTVAMSACGSWALGQLSATWPDTFADTAVAAFPSIDGDPTKTTSTLGGWTLTVDSKSDQPQAAADFISWLLAGDPAIMTSFFDAAGYSKYPVRTSVNAALAADPVASANTNLSVVTSDILPYAQPEPVYPWDISLAMGTAIEKSMRGGNIDDALAEANATIDSVIAQQSLAGTAP